MESKPERKKEPIFCMTARPMCETDLYVLFRDKEDVFLFDKNGNREVWRTEMYGNPTCGLIGLSNEWAIFGGQGIIIWKDNSLKAIEDSDIQWILDVRQSGEHEVEILTDPWRPDSAIWSFDIVRETKRKIRDFDDYRAKEFTNEVKW